MRARNTGFQPVREILARVQKPVLLMNSILVLNAGSSSLKFSVFLDTREKPQLLLRGQAEALLTQPHFVARDAKGKVLEDRSWNEGKKLDHESVTQFLLDWIGKRMAEHKLSAAGHRVVHGGIRFHEPVRIDDRV